MPALPRQLGTIQRAIWKFEVEPWRLDMEMPLGAKLLHVHAQAGRTFVWAEVDPDNPTVRRDVRGLMTGANVPDGFAYVGTAHISDPAGGSIVVHVYDGGEISGDA